MTRLRDAAVAAPIKMALDVPGGMHNNTWLIGGTKYIRQVRHFLKAAAAYRKTNPSISDKSSATKSSKSSKPKVKKVIHALPVRGRITTTATLELLTDSSDSEEEEEEGHGHAEEFEAKSNEEEDFPGLEAMLKEKKLITTVPPISIDHTKDLEVMKHVQQMMSNFNGGEDLKVCLE